MLSSARLIERMLSQNLYQDIIYGMKHNRLVFYNFNKS